MIAKQLDIFNKCIRIQIRIRVKIDTPMIVKQLQSINNSLPFEFKVKQAIMIIGSVGFATRVIKNDHERIGMSCEHNEGIRRRIDMSREDVEGDFFEIAPLSNNRK